MNQIVLDYETFSFVDLKKVGAVKYSKAAGILCGSYKINEEKTKLWVPTLHQFPKELIQVAKDKSFTFVAHNALFEQVITENVLRKKIKDFPYLPPERWKCTAAKAATCALPRSLEGAGAAIGLPIKKNMDGRALMLKYCKPSRRWNNWKAFDTKFDSKKIMVQPDAFYNDEMELLAIFDYCKTDVDVTYLLDKVLPDLSENEKRIWIENQKMNLRGVHTDTQTARKIINLIEYKSEFLLEETREITDGYVDSPTQRNKLLEYLNHIGCDIENLQAKTIENYLERKDIKEEVRRLLEIRQSVGKSSNKKFYAIIDKSDNDSRVKDLAMYHGASTGRDTGQGLQIHNLPKGKISNQDFAIDLINQNSPYSEIFEDLEFYYRNPFNVFSGVMRGMITATPNFKMYCADYNAIECRILNWVAGHDDVINDFREGKDPYIKMASRIFGIPQHLINGEQRFLGKTAELGCGYQMGDDRFFETCIEWGVPNVTRELAQKAVRIYRETHQPVTKLWSNVENSAISAIRKKGTVFKSNKIKWLVKDNFLWCRLPSGRKLAFYGPTLRNERTPWGEFRPKIYHWSVHPKTKQWVNAATYGGRLLENIIQGTARDIAFHGILNAIDKGYYYLFQVHDEIICESKKGNLEEYEKLLVDKPLWAKGLPIAAKGWVGYRYKK